MRGINGRAGFTPEALTYGIPCATLDGMADSIIIRDPEIMSGVPCFKGTRVPFQTLLDYLETGETLDDFLEQFPTVTREMAIAALENAKESLLASIG